MDNLLCVYGVDSGRKPRPQVVCDVERNTLLLVELKHIHLAHLSDDHQLSHAWVHLICHGRHAIHTQCRVDDVMLCQAEVVRIRSQLVNILSFNVKSSNKLLT